jgi:adhesin transport system outer membrane protein
MSMGFKRKSDRQARRMAVHLSVAALLAALPLLSSPSVQAQGTIVGFGVPADEQLEPFTTQSTPAARAPAAPRAPANPVVSQPPAPRPQAVPAAPRVAAPERPRPPQPATSAPLVLAPPVAATAPAPSAAPAPLPPARAIGARPGDAPAAAPVESARPAPRNAPGLLPALFGSRATQGEPVPVPTVDVNRPANPPLPAVAGRGGEAAPLITGSVPTPAQAPPPTGAPRETVLEGGPARATAPAGGQAATTPAATTPAAATPALEKPSSDKPVEPSSRLRVTVPSGPSMSLYEAVARSVDVHPQIDEAKARVDEAWAGVDAARVPQRATLDLRAGVGHASAPQATQDFNFRNPELGTARIDPGASLRLLLFDFGATNQDIKKSLRLLDAERLKQYDKIEEVAFRVTQAYLRILETRDMLAAADESVSGLRNVARLVNENMRNGNGTLADVKRVDARLIDMEAQRADLSAELQAATDQFRRLARIEPGRLLPAPNLASSLPAGVEAALSLARQQHPKILTATMARRATEHELAASRASSLPRITAEADAQGRVFRGDTERGEGDLRAMVVMRYRLFDGGASRSQQSQISARVRQTDAKLRDISEEVEADIRQFYRSISTARSKFASLSEGVDASRKVVTLYTEQFQSGRRTLFELLDAQAALYAARRSFINAQFEERRGVYGILRSTGQLTPAISRLEPGANAPVRRRG